MLSSTMIVPFIFIVLGLSALVFLFRLARHRSMVISKTEDLPGRLRPVDLEAFRNLIDRDEEAYLRLNLTPGLFRSIQRERLRAAAEYVSCALYNAGVLLQLGAAAARSLDPRVAEAGRDLVDNAVRLRWYAILAIMRLYAGIAFPQFQFSPLAVFDRYQQLSASLTHLGRLQYPTRGARISATL